MEIAAAVPAVPATSGSKAGARGAGGEDQDASLFQSQLAAWQPVEDPLAEPDAGAGEALAPGASGASEEALSVEPSPGEVGPVAAQPVATPMPGPEEDAGRLAVDAGPATVPGARAAPGIDASVRTRGDDAVPPPEEPVSAGAVEEVPSEVASSGVLSATGRKPRAAGAGGQPLQEVAVSGPQAGETRQLQRHAQAAELQAAAEVRSGNPAVQAASTGAAAAALAEAWSGNGRPHPAARGGERHAERGAQPLSTLALAAGSTDVTVQGNGAAMAPTAASALVPAGAQATATLAEKMRFWSLRGVQNATLELEAFDGARVDVHIAMQGREAKVEFLSDAPEARRWLQEAMPQLEDMLQAQGIALAGGFVGTGSRQQGDAAARDPRAVPAAARNGVVRMGLADVQALQGGTASGLPRGMGHTVDLFV